MAELDSLIYIKKLAGKNIQQNKILQSVFFIFLYFIDFILSLLVVDSPELLRVKQCTSLIKEEF